MLRSGSQPQSRSYHGAGGAPSSVAPQIGDSVLGHGDGTGGYGGKVHDGDRFLDQAKEVKISQADRQEGYDTTLLALKPRQTTVETTEVPRPTSPIPDSASPLVATAQQPIASQVAYAARDPTSEKERQSKKRRSRRKSKRRPWYQTPMALLVGGGFVLLGLGVGLGVGLGLHKTSKSAPSTTASAAVPNVSTAGSAATQSSLDEAPNFTTVNSPQPSASAAARDGDRRVRRTTSWT